MPWHTILGSTMFRWLLLAATLPFVLRVAWRVPPLPLTSRTIAVHLGTFALLALVQAMVSARAMAVAAPHVAVMFSWTARVTRAFYEAMPLMVSAYGAVLFAAWGMREARDRERRARRESQLEAQLQAARLAALRAQLQPHFLYNTLTAISALVSDHRPEQAVAAIERLGELLHASLRDDSQQEITLREEAALAEQYLALQRMRFGDRLHYELEIPPAVEAFPVPVLLLQPIVENAVVHGLEGGAGTVRVRVVAEASTEGAEIRVEDDGAGPRSAATSSSRGTGNGVGLALTRARIATAYGPAATLDLLPRDGGGTVVRLRLPRRISA